MVRQLQASRFFGIVTATYFLSIAFGASLSPHISPIFKRRHAMTLAATFACLAGVQIALALQGSIIGFVTVFVLYSVFCDPWRQRNASQQHFAPLRRRPPAVDHAIVEIADPTIWASVGRGSR